MAGVRIDKWLWAVRAYKTRTVAADACKNGRVTINGALAKASRDVKIGDVVSFKKISITYSYEVVDLIGNRQPAKNVGLYARNVTPASELAKLNAPNETVFVSRDRGTGRPTKRDRREIEDVMDGFFYDDDDDDE